MISYKYQVTLYYPITKDEATVTVEAESEKHAVYKARNSAEVRSLELSNYPAQPILEKMRVIKRETRSLGNALVVQESYLS